MDERALYQLVKDLKNGAVDPDAAVSMLRRLPFSDIGDAKVDHHRYLRQGVAEAVYAPGKTPQQCADVVAELLSESDGGPVLLTRANDEQLAAVQNAAPGAKVSESAAPGQWTATWRPTNQRDERVVVVTAGTADLPVAGEAVATLQAYGFRPTSLVDCGVAGVHRLFASRKLLEEAAVIVVVAGMEGALASLVGGITAAAVVAVPTSAGYGSSFAGVTALLSMLSSCAAGITVVGIDNGFGAGCAVARMLRKAPNSGTSDTVPSDGAVPKT